MSIWPKWLLNRAGPSNRAQHRAQLERQAREQAASRQRRRDEEKAKILEAAERMRQERPTALQVVNRNGDSIRDGNGQPFIFDDRGRAERCASAIGGEYYVKDLNA